VSPRDPRLAFFKILLKAIIASHHLQEIGVVLRNERLPQAVRHADECRIAGVCQLVDVTLLRDSGRRVAVDSERSRAVEEEVERRKISLDIFVCSEKEELSFDDRPTCSDAGNDILTVRLL